MLCPHHAVPEQCILFSHAATEINPLQPLIKRLLFCHILSLFIVCHTLSFLSRHPVSRNKPPSPHCKATTKSSANEPAIFYCGK